MKDNNFPVFVRVSKSYYGTIYMDNRKEAKQNKEISFSYLPAPDFQHEYQYQVVETGEIKSYRPYDHVDGFIIFVSEKTYKELANEKRMFYVHYVMKDEKDKDNGWRADKGLSEESKNELLRLSMEKETSWN